MTRIPHTVIFIHRLLRRFVKGVWENLHKLIVFKPDAVQWTTYSSRPRTSGRTKVQFNQFIRSRSTKMVITLPH